ncbi:hypothetical protein B0H17DRAFT_1335997 [Mycena rosella]|uniref:Uncharacterized protein n=1 Tax=Mycena rosella TaxID=1033263 RepID=A0AAD7CX64_MYCRO|nr:hypothetical protein B0H17DRAFT_1335997 [Mycena rosella]
MSDIKLLRTTAVAVTYTGTTPITVDPPLAGSAGLTKSKATTVDKTSSAYQFSANNQVIGSVWNHDDMDKVEIAGGLQVGGTTPFKVKVR